MGRFTPGTIKKCCDALKPRRERYPLALVMERWAALVEEAKPEHEPEHGRVEADHFVWCGSEDPVALLVGEPLVQRRRPLKRTKWKTYVQSGKRTKWARRPADEDAALLEYAALLLAAIFCEFTGDAPTRKYNARKRMETSQFYWFASIASEAIGLPITQSELHAVCKRWDRSDNFYKRAMGKLLFGGLVPKKGERLLRPRRKKSRQRLLRKYLRRQTNMSKVDLYQVA